MTNYVASVGMEVHAELLTNSKMFCRCPVAFGGEPNTRVCPVCLGLPGALPVPNRQAIEFVIKTALALNCEIAMNSIFHRKNYFYPDLPKGYQISQYGDTNPLGYNGYLDIPVATGVKRIKIRRVHLEEDTGKLLHFPGGGSGVDYNRAGVPLMEIVTEFPPDIETEEEAREYLVQLRQILLYLEVCDGKMEEGSLRCEPNISIRPAGGPELGVKSELKNLNSFRAVQLGVRFEVARQKAALQKGEPLLQETRGWNEAKEESFPMRVKEMENDYRYFPDPDLAPMSFEDVYVGRLRTALPELPLAKTQRYQTAFGLTDYDAGLLVADKKWATFFERGVDLGAEPKLLCNWMNSDFAKLLNESGQTTDNSRVGPEHLCDLLKLIGDGTISGKIAKDVLSQSFQSGKMPSKIVSELGLEQVSDERLLRSYVGQVLQQNEESVAKYRAGQTGVLGFFVGQVMKLSQGKAKPELVQQLIKEVLDS